MEVLKELVRLFGPLPLTVLGTVVIVCLAAVVLRCFRMWTDVKKREMDSEKSRDLLEIKSEKIRDLFDLKQYMIEHGMPPDQIEKTLHAGHPDQLQKLEKNKQELTAECNTLQDRVRKLKNWEASLKQTIRSETAYLGGNNSALVDEFQRIPMNPGNKKECFFGENGNTVQHFSEIVGSLKDNQHDRVSMCFRCGCMWQNESEKSVDPTQVQWDSKKDLHRWLWSAKQVVKTARSIKTEASNREKDLERQQMEQWWETQKEQMYEEEALRAMAMLRPHHYRN